MAEYIEREAAEDELLSWSVCINHPEYLMLEDAIHALDDIPSADVAQVVHGQLELDTEDIYRCSNCAEKSHVKEVMGRPAWGYFQNCGAKMDGANDV